MEWKIEERKEKKHDYRNKMDRRSVLQCKGTRNKKKPARLIEKRKKGQNCI